MCGIAGYIDKTGSQINATLLKDMTDRISHRGPDGHGVHCVENVGIAHRRLSIIDLASGAQPMCNEDGSVWITFNGELYNYLELQKQLKAFGHIFKTNSDTEVIIHAYEQWGADCLRRLRGMFAFAIADEKKKKLLIVRDQFGIKPVFYFVSEKGLAFASELQAFKAIPHFNPEIDIKALDQYLLLQYIPAPLTIFKNVYKLKPAHYIEVGFNGSISEQRQYWDYSFRPNYSVKDSDWIEIIEEQIKESVKAHLVSDVPFGAFLSGGIDSSLVVTHMSQILDKPVKTFSIGFKEEEYNELAYASLVAKACGTEHFTEIIEPDAISILPQLVKHYGEPFADSSAIPTYYVSKLARKHVTMALSGDGGDELFAGYSSYAQWLKQNPISYYSGIKKTAYTYLNKILPSKYPIHDSLKKWYACIGFLDIESRLKIWRPEFNSHVSNNVELFIDSHVRASGFTAANKAQYIDSKTYMPFDILTKVDVASMMHSLEVRPPFIDVKLWELAAAIPEEVNINHQNFQWSGKHLLKSILLKYYPSDFVHRKKMGFAIPLHKWFSNPIQLESMLQERIYDSNSPLSKYFQANELRSLMVERKNNPVWMFLFLDEWLRQFNSK